MAYPYNTILFSHKKNEVLIHATTWMNLEDSMPNERNVTKGDMLYGSIYYEMSRIGKSIEAENRFVIAWGWGLGGVLMGVGFLLGIKIDCGDGYTTL